MNENQWNVWCRSVHERLTKIEKTLASYHKVQKRMLYMMGLGFVAVLVNGILLFYK
jgi:hypothetical protein